MENCYYTLIEQLIILLEHPKVFIESLLGGEEILIVYKMKLFIKIFCRYLIICMSADLCLIANLIIISIDDLLF